MRKIFTRWFQKSSVNPRATLTFAAVWVVALLAIHLLVPTRTIESRVISPLLFKIRDHLGQSPTLNSKIKIFGIDDMTAARLQRPDMNLEEWSKVLTLIDHSKPKAIIIDGLFSLADAGSSLEGLMALARLKRIETPIYTGLFPSRAPIIARTPYKLLNETYDLTTYVDRSMPLPGSEAEQLEKLPLADFRGSVIYGPNLSLHSVFHNAGHILYGEDEGSYMPFLRVDENKTVPHMMVMPFAKTNFQQDRLFIEGAEVFVAQDGSAPINFPSRGHMYRSVSSLWPLIEARDQNVVIDSIKTGDYVYIIPLFHTGNTDFKPSPIGLIPGAFAHLSVLNSYLEKSPLHYLEIEPI
ncbi:MAG: CHASE2 domain-containing protein, partial [Proteobacteria bacterium]